MDISFILLLFFIGSVGSFMSGMLGAGGAIINYPLLLYIPVLLGFTGFNAHQVSGIVAVQVFFATFSGVWAYRKGGYLNKELIFIMGLSILLGSLIGGYGSHFFSEDLINLVYGLLAIIAAIIMLIPKTGTEGNQSDHIRFPKILTSIMTFIVGLASGIVGAGGAFLLVPLMLVILKIPARITIATSLAVTFISSIGTTATKLVIGQVPIMPALVVMAASLIASPLGVFIGKKVNAKVLQGILIFVILITTVKIWVDILHV
ncbi:sulfite exporter TauE/SafE family protein [Bacillus haynesii]|uniref:sulfite exporter TauE/SafE family protein n=1 Tax=Bacillus haynesii TaxID=1925021 RepID=UPI00227F37CE|nr:sulfite exporter TauE/SafE family protein [Bacillus haynesii]MCY8009497.1 sulfite exporter TauE/SafE family protein [Bacillus haynesii]MCY8755038.1 sulfite exporter TauE/SafE family protein [Bacillus haynesii]MCY9274805.1 sulfite exporter TauE/SafE family protein [Bacillus haynesii]MCY9399797.1 sulfite exporter TauE/SafE family protein [Bacillus haynesii]MEC0707522.1 sulfite exporter TauE/SafE family protein [Bacillus haynesii]